MARLYAFALLIFWLKWVECSLPPAVRTCETITVRHCLDIEYNVTGMPNLAKQESQSEAEFMLDTFRHLISTECSSQLKFFLCSVYVPMCTEKVMTPIGPCKPLCLRVRNRCLPILTRYDYPWPDALDCENFPEKNDKTVMCMEGPPAFDEKNFSLIDHIETNESYESTEAPNEDNLPKVNEICQYYNNSNNMLDSPKTQKCVQRCGSDVFFSDTIKQFAPAWIAVWSIACIASVVVAFFIYFKNPSCFNYPEKAIIFISFNYLLSCIAYFIVLIMGREAISCYKDPVLSVSLLIQGSRFSNLSCSLVFILLYFSSQSSLICWCILCYTWFLVTGKQENPLDINKLSTVFKSIAIIIPVIMTILVLVWSYVDGDELTGACFVGTQNDKALLIFVIVPNTLWIIVGVFFLLLGLYKLHVFKKIKMFNLMPIINSLTVRLGFFALFCVVPFCSTLAVNLYEYCWRYSWYETDRRGRLVDEIFTCKLFMSLMVGINSGLWIFLSRHLIILQSKPSPIRDRGLIWSRLYSRDVAREAALQSALLSPTKPSFSSVSKVPVTALGTGSSKISVSIPGRGETTVF